jgi:ABC-2 type transport system ATP-binding protein
MDEKQYSIRVEGIQKSYGFRKILKGVSFTAEQGQCVAIVGLNGSGKSTLLSILAGVQKADKGTAVCQGVDIFKNRKAAGRIIGYVPQENPLIQDLTVRDNLKLWYCDSPFDMNQELKDGFLKLLGIDKMLKIPVKKLSGGMKKRVSIGISMWADPSVLMLDEPSAALDLVAKKDIRDYLQAYRKKGGTVLIATHDEDELDICDKVYVVKDGVLKETDTKLRGDRLLEEIV